MRRIAVIIPTLDEEPRIAATLASVRAAGKALGPHQAEVSTLVVDGGSSDRTVELARAGGALVIASARGRAAQMNAGAAQVVADVMVFLHADTQLPEQGLRHLVAALEAAPGPAAWGRFDVRLEPSSPLLSLVAAAMNLRSRASGIATGDQAIFVTRLAWQQVGRFPPIALMEDVEISRRLKKVAGRPLCLRAKVTVSSRRWRANGVWRTIVSMWLYRALYALGATPDYLHRCYYRQRGSNRSAGIGDSSRGAS